MTKWWERSGVPFEETTTPGFHCLHAWRPTPANRNIPLSCSFQGKFQGGLSIGSSAFPKPTSEIRGRSSLIARPGLCVCSCGEMERASTTQSRWNAFSIVHSNWLAWLMEWYHCSQIFSIFCSREYFYFHFMYNINFYNL